MNNSDDDLMRMFNSAFNGLTDSTVDLCPEELREEIDRLNAFLYENVNDGDAPVVGWLGSLVRFAEKSEPIDGVRRVPRSIS